MSEFSGLIRPVEEMDRDEWLRMRDALWPNGSPQEHLAEMEIYQVRGGLDICLVAERPGGGLCGFVEAGRAILAGPCLDQTFGIVIVRAHSLEEARSLMQADPAVRNGIMSAELHPFRVSLMGRKGP
jgi:hypothetical protein